MTVLLIALGGALGAPARYLIDQALRARLRSSFPYGTLAVNLVGSLLAGMVLAAAGNDALSPELASALAVGFCGALTTFSTFSYDTLRLAEQQAYRVAALNVVANLAGSVLAAAAGWTLLS